MKWPIALSIIWTAVVVALCIWMAQHINATPVSPEVDGARFQKLGSAAAGLWMPIMAIIWGVQLYRHLNPKTPPQT
jgi:hypothetical protein